MFDPTKPASNTPLSSSEIRAQLNALKALIDAMQTTLNAVNNGVANLQNQLTALTADTSHNCTSVGDLSVSLSNPPQQSEVQMIVDKMNELLGVLRR